MVQPDLELDVNFSMAMAMAAAREKPKPHDGREAPLSHHLLLLLLLLLHHRRAPDPSDGDPGVVHADGVCEGPHEHGLRRDVPDELAFRDAPDLH
jgi:hypothetical protein